MENSTLFFSPSWRWLFVPRHLGYPGGSPRSCFSWHIHPSFRDSDGFLAAAFVHIHLSTGRLGKRHWWWKLSVRERQSWVTNIYLKKNCFFGGWQFFRPELVSPRIFGFLPNNQGFDHRIWQIPKYPETHMDLTSSKRDLGRFEETPLSYLAVLKTSSCFGPKYFFYKADWQNISCSLTLAGWNQTWSTMLGRFWYLKSIEKCVQVCTYMHDLCVLQKTSSTCNIYVIYIYVSYNTI